MLGRISAVVVAAFLFIPVIFIQTGQAASGPGGRCGGFVGARCEPGLTCQGDTRNDKMGDCVPQGGGGGPRVSGPGGRCGGFAGFRCAPGLTCQGDTRNDRMGICTAGGGREGGGSRFCSRIYSPVCGADGRSYPNSCEAERNGVPVRHPGRCYARFWR